MHPDLDRLIRLQELDTTVDRTRRLLAEGPQMLAALDARLVAALGTVEVARHRLQGSQTSRRAIEKDLAVLQARLSKFKDQLMEVKTNREYQAVQKEIAVAQRETGEMEDRVLERLLEADELAAAIKIAETELAAEERSIATERAAIERERTQLERELDRAVPARDDLATEIASSLLAVFEQVARGRKGVAMAEARDGLCTICHVRLRPQVFNEIRGNRSIIQCDSCQRILYFAPVGVEDHPS